jgi:RNA polymerase sigma-70 factor (sigma-E family)
LSDVGGGPTFEEFVASRGRDLWRSAWLLTGDTHQAEDLVQAALLKCWRRWPAISRDGSVEAYVRRAMVSTYTDWWRRKWRSELPTEVLPDGVDAATYAVEERQDALAALALLPRGQRAVLVLRFYDDLTEAQTAEVLSVTVGTVKSQTARALKALRSSPMMKEQA